jgi:hypothetical protein
MKILLLILRRLWALPNTLIGLIYGILGLVLGAKVHWAGDVGILRFTDVPKSILGTAMSLGHVQLFSAGYFKTFGGDYTPNRFGVSVVAEETLHTRQAEVLGPFYLLFYGLGLIISLITTRTTHHNNFMEKAPERGAGLWPWETKDSQKTANS